MPIAPQKEHKSLKTVFGVYKTMASNNVFYLDDGTIDSAKQTWLDLAKESKSIA